MTFGSTTLGSTTFGSGSAAAASVAVTPVVNLLIRGSRITWLIQSKVVILQPRVPFK
jgi:hypothetical protein